MRTSAYLSLQHRNEGAVPMFCQERIDRMLAISFALLISGALINVAAFSGTA